MILPVHERLREHLRRAMTQTFGLAVADQPAIVIETPPRRALGDLAVPVAFELARKLRKAPRAIAQELAVAVGPVDGVARAEAAPNGHLNFFLTRAAFLTDALRPASAAATPGPADPGKVIVEHTAINPNKAAHIGHLRNAALGDTLVRLLRFQGRPVEVQNYIDDTGVGNGGGDDAAGDAFADQRHLLLRTTRRSPPSQGLGREFRGALVWLHQFEVAALRTDDVDDERQRPLHELHGGLDLIQVQ
jgi:hypothetical protein